MINKDISVILYQECLIVYSEDSTKGALQYKVTIFVTMATYWVPDLHDIKSFSEHFKHSKLIFVNGASSA